MLLPRRSMSSRRATFSFGLSFIRSPPCSAGSCSEPSIVAAANRLARTGVREGASGARGRDAEPVAVGVFEITLPPGEALFIDRNPELLRDRVDVAYVQMNERVRTSVALVFGEVEPDASSCHGDEPRKPRLELVLPLLVESESL